MESFCNFIRLCLLWSSLMWVTKLCSHLPPNTVERLCWPGWTGNLPSVHEYVNGICTLSLPFVFQWKSSVIESKGLSLWAVWSCMSTSLSAFFSGVTWSGLNWKWQWHTSTANQIGSNHVHTWWSRSVFLNKGTWIDHTTNSCWYSVKKFWSLASIKATLQCHSALGFSWGQQIKCQIESFNVEHN